MTQPYYSPQQGYPPPPPDPYAQTPYAVNQQPPYPAQYQPNPYAQPQPGPYGFPAPPPQQQGPPLAKGSLDDFYTQPNTGGGKAISWNGKPDGYTIVATVSREITQGDVRQDTDPKTRQPKYHADGRPKFSLIVPFRLLAQYPDYPEGEARLFLRGQLRDETSRAMAEAGVTDPNTPPEHGSLMAVTLSYRKPTNAIAQNVFVVAYWRPGAWDLNTVQAVLQGLARQATSAEQIVTPYPQFPQPQAANTQPQAPTYAPNPASPQPQPPQPVQQYAPAPVQPQYAPAGQPQAGQQGAAPATQPYQPQAQHYPQSAPALAPPGPGQVAGQVQGQMPLPIHQQQGEQQVPSQSGPPVPDPNGQLSSEQQGFLARLKAQQAATAPAQE